MPKSLSAVCGLLAHREWRKRSPIEV